MVFNLLMKAIGLGFGLAADAFSVSVSNGIRDKQMTLTKVNHMAFLFGFFQCLMPLLGYFAVLFMLGWFQVLLNWIPWIAFAILCYLGLKLILDKETDCSLSPQNYISQAVATSLDALSIGFTLATYSWPQALLMAFIVGVVTYGICLFAALVGKKLGQHLLQYSSLFGGLILITIGIGMVL